MLILVDRFGLIYLALASGLANGSTSLEEGPCRAIIHTRIAVSVLLAGVEALHVLYLSLADRNFLFYGIFAGGGIFEADVVVVCPDLDDFEDTLLAACVTRFSVFLEKSIWWTKVYAGLSHGVVILIGVTARFRADIIAVFIICTCWACCGTEGQRFGLLVLFEIQIFTLCQTDVLLTIYSVMTISTNVFALFCHVRFDEFVVCRTSIGIAMLIRLFSLSGDHQLLAHVVPAVRGRDTLSVR